MKDDYLNLAAAACVLVASKQGERPSQVPTEQQLESVTGLQVPCPALPCPADVSLSSLQTQTCLHAQLITSAEFASRFKAKQKVANS